MLDGVCITGGEPTLQPDLEEFIKKVKEFGFLVKLDTNGYKPDLLERLIDSGLLDYVAMDIKNSGESYGKTVGCKDFDITPILDSVEILKNGKVPFEFRTTLVKELHTESDILKIAEWLKGDSKYFLQNFKDSGDIIEEGFTAFSEEELKKLKIILQGMVPNTKIR